MEHTKISLSKRDDLNLEFPLYKVIDNQAFATGVVITSQCETVQSMILMGENPHKKFQTVFEVKNEKKTSCVSNIQFIFIFYIRIGLREPVYIIKLDQQWSNMKYNQLTSNITFYQYN